MFPSPELPGRPIATRSVYERMVELGDKVGIANFHPHRLRHTFATLLYEATGDIMKVRTAMGHDNIANTMVYTQVNPQGIREAIDGLAVWGRQPDAPTPSVSEPVATPRAPDLLG